MTVRATTTFDRPGALSAPSPPEARGLARDEVRLLVARPERLDHAVFRDLTRHLRAGDLVVVNTTATIAAALTGTRPDGRTVAVHLSSPLADNTYVVELRSADGALRVTDGRAGEQITLAEGRLTLQRAYPDPSLRVGSRLWQASFVLATDLQTQLLDRGRVIAYGYVDGRWPLEAYQTVFGRDPGSAEMASAGRPFSDHLVTDLITSGIQLAPITLHTGVSSLEAGELPLPERYRVPPSTARLVNGLVTGWHEPQASHLMLLEAVAGSGLVQRAYDAALAEKYLWHEFGDSALLLP